MFVFSADILESVYLESVYLEIGRVTSLDQVVVMSQGATVRRR